MVGTSFFALKWCKQRTEDTIFIGKMSNLIAVNWIGRGRGSSSSARSTPSNFYIYLPWNWHPNKPINQNSTTLVFCILLILYNTAITALLGRSLSLSSLIRRYADLLPAAPPCNSFTVFFFFPIFLHFEASFTSHCPPSFSRFVSFLSPMERRRWSYWSDNRYLYRLSLGSSWVPTPEPWGVSWYGVLSSVA